LQGSFREFPPVAFDVFAEVRDHLIVGPKKSHRRGKVKNWHDALSNFFRPSICIMD